MSDLQAPSTGQETDEDPPPKHWKEDSQGAPETRSEPECIVHIHGLLYHRLLVLLATNKDSIARILRLKEIRDMRLEQPDRTVQHMMSTCDLIPDSLTEGRGYHRECYQRFTMNFNRLSTHPKSSRPSCSKLMGLLIVVKVLHHCRIRLC